MSNFKTTSGITFNVTLKTKDVLVVREMVKYENGKQVDIFEAAETGTLARIYGDLKILIDVMFVICLDQIKEYFDVKKFDESNQKTYELFPDQADEPPVVKASRWFGSILDGDSVGQIIEAFKESVINFTPSATRRAALQTIMIKEKEIEQLETEYRLNTLNKIYETTKNSMEQRWEILAKQKQKEIMSELDGRSEISTSTQELSELNLIPLALRNSD
jgi:hypothetical protein